MTIINLWVCVYMVFFPAPDVDWSVKFHWEAFESRESCLKEANRLREFDNVISAWCDKNGGFY